MQILYISTSGAGDPTRASLPWHLAVNGSLPEGQQPVLVLAGDATDLLIGDRLDTLQGVGVPPMAEMVAKAREHDVPVYV